jgi:hypothetical protein
MRQQAPGLAFYSTLEADIAQCQARYGKKILLSIGGQGNSLPLASDQDAIAFADRLWELFRPAGKIDPALRPFGSAILDGFDLSTSSFPNTPPAPPNLPVVLTHEKNRQTRRVRRELRHLRRHVARALRRR